MGISHSTASLLAPASFIYDFAAQQYGIFSTPNMQDIHERNLSFFSPQPQFIGAFFFPQQLVQIAWLYRLVRRQGTEEELAAMRDYAPYYALGNVCIGTWMFFWNANNLQASNAAAVDGERDQEGQYYELLTNIVAKTFAGIGVLDLLHNTSAAYFVGEQPSLLTKVLTGVGFAGLAASSDWILGGCFVYDLVALAVGQTGQWRTLLGGYAAGAGLITAVLNAS